MLLGDAAWCPTLYSGHGSALALAGGERLGHHLAATPGRVVDVIAGLAAWEREQRPAADGARVAARRARHFFLPGNRLVAAVRQAALRVASWPPAGRALQAVSVASSRVRPPDPGEVHPTAMRPSGATAGGAP